MSQAIPPQTLSDEDAVREVLGYYVEGLRTGSAETLRATSAMTSMTGSSC